jgi:hypothetical protein
LQSNTVGTNKLAQAIGQFESDSVNTAQADLAKDLSNQVKLTSQLIPTALMVETMRVFEANGTALDVGSFSESATTKVAGAASLAIGVANDEKVKSKNSIDNNGSGLFLSGKI